MDRPTTMRAAWYDRTGPAADVLRVGERPVPAPAPGEVLVRIHASGINPSDTKKRAGWLGAAMPFPEVVPHSDGAGVIAAVGNGVDPARIGSRVWLWNAQVDQAFGTCAEFCAVPSEQAVPLPDAVDFATGACLGVPAQTAHYAVMADGAPQGQTVLVQGGGGAVGQLAVQWAVWAGAQVIATAGSAESQAAAAEAGAHHVIDRHGGDVEAAIRVVAPDGVDRIVEVDFGANIALDAALIRDNGVIASYSSTSAPEPALPYYPLAYKGVTLRLVQVYILAAGARAAAVAEIGQALSEGSLRPTVAARFPLAAVAEAHAMAEGPHPPGTIVVEI